MTSPVAVVGLRVNGFDVQRADLGIFLDLTEGLDEFPAVRGSDDVVPFMTGTVHLARTADSKKLVMAGVVMADAAAGVRAFVNQLKRAIDPTTTTRLTVEATVEDGAVWTIEARPANLLSNAPVPQLHNVSLELDAQPYWRRTWGTWTLDSGLYLDDSLVLDDSSTIDVEPDASPYDITFNALGTAHIRDAVVTIYGPSTGAIGFRNLTLGQVGFQYPALAADEVLVVDTGNRTVALDGVNRRNLLSLMAANARGEYFRLADGVNTLRVTGQPDRVVLPFSSCY